MTHFYIDTAGTDLWKWDTGPLHPAQPDLVRLAWCTDEAGSEQSLLIRPVRSISADAVAVHGIPAREAAERGITSRSALTEFLEDMKAAEPSVMVGYSWDFHRKLVERASSLFLGTSMEWPTQTVCLMRAAAPIVKVRKQKNGQWAWPKFGDAYAYFAGQPYVADPDPVEEGIKRVTALRMMHQKLLAAVA